MPATASNAKLPDTAVLSRSTWGRTDIKISSRQSVLWRTWFAAITQPILLRMGPQSLRVLLAIFCFLTLQFARCSYYQCSWFLICFRQTK